MLHIYKPRDIIYNGTIYRDWRGDVYAGGEPKSVLRGFFHLIAIFTIIPIQLFVLIFLHNNLQQLGYGLFFIATHLTLYTTSGLLHRVKWTRRQHDIVKRFDHSAIFIIMFGNGYVLFLLIQKVYPNLQYIPIAIFSALYLLGIVNSMIKNLSENIDNCSIIIYITMGAYYYLPFIWHIYTVMIFNEFVVFMISLVIAISSLLIYKFRLCDFIRDIFGYHEVFHICVTLFNLLSTYITYSILLRSF